MACRTTATGPGSSPGRHFVFFAVFRLAQCVETGLFFSISSRLRPLALAQNSASSARSMVLSRVPPMWAMLALALLPLWAFMYARAVTTQAEAAAGPLSVGTETYSVCASCHGGAGEGGVGYAFANGEVLKTFPHIEDQLRFVYYGSEQYSAAGVEIYGDPDREGGPHVVLEQGVMPAWGGNLTDAEILGVVCHERYDLGGGDPGDMATEFDEWCAEDSEIFERARQAAAGTSPCGLSSGQCILPIHCRHSRLRG